MKKWLILVVSVLMLMFLGTNQAWSVFVHPLRAKYGFSAVQMQLIFNTAVFTFCTIIIVGGRLHDRFGPRLLAMVSAAFIALAWGLASASGGRYILLWLSLGVLGATGSAVGYVCPIATVIKWFPRHPGLVSGLAAAGFGCGPILLSAIAEALMRREWEVERVFGLISVIYAPAILLFSTMLLLPPGLPHGAEVVNFRRRARLRDRRFWVLFLGMFIGTLPFLVVTGNAKPLAEEFGIGPSMAAFAISVLALGNSSGRIAWGVLFDRLGARRAIVSAQSILIVCMAMLILGGRFTSICFFAALFGVGMCYGSNFAIYPATVARLYGSHMLGSVYPFIMAAQGISSFSTSINGILKDVTGSSIPGLIFAGAIALAGALLCAMLNRSLCDED